MRLRTKILVLIGGTFLLIFVLAQFAEHYITKESLKQEQKLISAELAKMQEKQKESMARFLRSVLDERKQKIDVLFNRIVSYEWIKSRFQPSLSNAKHHTWMSAIALLYTNKWIDYLENTNEGDVTSLIVVENRFSKYAIKVPIDHGLSLCFIRDSKNPDNISGPYVLIQYNLDHTVLEHIDLGIKEQDQNDYRGAFSFLFSVESIQKLAKKGFDQDVIKHLSAKLNNDSSQLYGLKEFKRALSEVIAQVQKANEAIDKHQSIFDEIKEQGAGVWVKPYLQKYSASIDRLNDSFQDHSTMTSLSMRMDKVSMIWQLGTLLASEIIGHSPFDDNFPKCVTQILPSGQVGFAIDVRDVFFDEPVLRMSKEFQTVPYQIKKEGRFIDVVYEDIHHNLFLGSHLELFTNTPQHRNGTLTIAVDVRNTVRQLALATTTMAFFVSKQQVLKAYDADGHELTHPFLPLDMIQDNKMGHFSKKGVVYSYIRVQPYPNSNFFYYIVSPKKEQFSIQYIFKESGLKMIRHVSTQMHIIVAIACMILLILISRLATRIARPVAALADACQSLKNGKLTEIALPEYKQSYHDEIAYLYQAFNSMIQGLKEKEKVMGALNKVVSPTVASEILKGNVHLGGEEREVTMLFADIRNFTKMTEAMPPHEVIDIINTCMTKISHVIDEHHGIIDKYVGDEVMALFGAPLQDENSTLHATECALHIMEELSKWNEERKVADLYPIEMGIGIHTGLVVAGNMGAENRLNYTVLGANVNLAFRLCSIAKPMQVLLSEEALKTLKHQDQFDLQKQDPIEVKGFHQKVITYSVHPRKS